MNAMSDERRAWTPEEVTLLRQQVALFATSAELAKQFDRPIGSIYTKLSALGLSLKKRSEQYPHGWGGTHEIPREPPAEEAAPPSPPQILPRDMVEYAMILKRFVRELFGEVVVIGFSGDSELGEAAVVFLQNGQRYQLRLEELVWQEQR